MNENKKTLVLSVVGVLLLIMVVVGVSYAMYSFAGEGTKVNQITTGSISVILDPTNAGVTPNSITLENTYPMTDEEGMKLAEANFFVSVSLSGTMQLKYEIGVDKLTSSLDDAYVRFYLERKAPGEAAYTQVKPAGTTMASIKNNAGTITGTGAISNYLLDSQTVNASGITAYKMKIWVGQDYDLPGQAMQNDGNIHANRTTSQDYSFKIKAIATQVL